MTTYNQEDSPKIYDQDFEMSVNKMIKKLQNRDFNSLEIEDLIEKILNLNESKKRTLKTDLIILTRGVIYGS